MGRPVGRVGTVQDTLIPTCPDSGLAITLVGAEALLATEKTIHAHKVIKTTLYNSFVKWTRSIIVSGMYIVCNTAGI